MAKATSAKDWRSDPDRRRELQAEYATVQGHYEDFDKRVLGLKGLATPLLGAGLAAGAKEHLPIVVWATILIALALWALETTWKAFQYCHRPRLERLEAWFRGAEAAEGDLKPFQVFQAWQAWQAEWEANWRWRPLAFLRICWGPFVCLPYLPVIGVGVAILVYLAER